jgi:transposase-like protein
MPKGKKHDPQLKAVVLAALLAGQGISQVAKQYHIDPSVVCRWRAKINPNDLQAVAKEKADEFTELISDAIESILKALKISADFIRSDEGRQWIKENSPSEVATFIGVLTDKGIRFLEAAEYSSQARDIETGELEAIPGASDSSIQ